MLGFLIISSLMKLDLSAQFGLFSVYSEHFMPYQFFTYMFLHGSTMHLLGNMIGLFFFGPLLEQFLGQKKFIILILAAGLGGGVLYWGVNYVELNGLKTDIDTYITDPNPDSFSALITEHDVLDRISVPDRNDMMEFIYAFDENPTNMNFQQSSINRTKGIFYLFSNIPMVGFSGAIFGILACFALLFPNTELYLLFIPFPIKAKYLVGAYIVYEIYSELERDPGDSVAHLAHLGGALIAYILIKLWKTKRDSFY